MDKTDKTSAGSSKTVTVSFECEKCCRLHHFTGKTAFTVLAYQCLNCKHTNRVAGPAPELKQALSQWIVDVGQRSAPKANGLQQEFDGAIQRLEAHPPCSIANMWQCGSCLTFNPLLSLACQGCKTPRGELNGEGSQP